jgi:Flp pilus assembly protein TadG
VLVTFAILIPSLCGIVGIVIDGGLMMTEHRRLQHATDAAATASATDLRLGKSAAVARTTAENYLKTENGLGDASVVVTIPPSSGPYAGRAGYVQVEAEREYRSKFMQVLNHVFDHTLHTRSVAGVDNVTAQAAIVVLDPNPLDTSVPDSDQLTSIPSASTADEVVSGMNISQQITSLGLGSATAGIVTRLTDALRTQIDEAITTATQAAAGVVDIPALPTLTGGLEIEGLGTLRVDGAIHVNNEWGGFDENGEAVGSAPGPPYAVACMVALPTTNLRARDLRVTGGVDDPQNYQNFEAGGKSPLQANRLPVNDPFRQLPVPSVTSDSSNVSPNLHDPGHAVVVSLGPASLLPSMTQDVVDAALAPLSSLVRSVVEPVVTPVIGDMVESLLTPPALTPGVYESITVVSAGEVKIDPGVYIIRGISPLTHKSLVILGGSVKADGVLFYITDSSAFSAQTGAPDASESSNDAPSNAATSADPSVVLVPALPASNISGLNDANSPFNGMLIYQRRLDRRPIVLGATQLIGGGNISGTVYSKWGHIIFQGGLGSYDLRFVTGTMRVVTMFDSTIAPTNPLPAAQDVLLVE